MYYFHQERGKFSKEEGTIAPPRIGARLSGGTTWHEKFANWTTYPVLLKGGYPTDDHGQADDIICPPMAGILRISDHPQEFAQYEVVSLSDARLSDATAFRGEGDNQRIALMREVDNLPSQKAMEDKRIHISFAEWIQELEKVAKEEREQYGWSPGLNSIAGRLGAFAEDVNDGIMVWDGWQQALRQRPS